jgi:hypothetical protein
VKEALAHLKTVEDEIIAAALDVTNVSGSALYLTDILAIASLNRAASLTRGFRDLLEARNFLAAAPLLRLALDNGLRLSAVWHVPDTSAFVREVLTGKSIRDCVDKEGKRLTVQRLIALAVDDADWLPEVYDKTSAYVHLSDAHIWNAFGDTRPDGGIGFTVGSSEDYLQDQTYIEAIAAFGAATDHFLQHIERWVHEKRTGAPPRALPQAQIRGAS